MEENLSTCWISETSYSEVKIIWPIAIELKIGFNSWIIKFTASFLVNYGRSTYFFRTKVADRGLTDSYQLWYKWWRHHPSRRTQHHTALLPGYRRTLETEQSFVDSWCPVVGCTHLQVNVSRQSGNVRIQMNAIMRSGGLEAPIRALYQNIAHWNLDFQATKT